MSKLIGKRLPEALLAYLSARPKKRRGTTVLLMTTDEEGWPHVAILSRWELFAKDRGSIRVATYASSGTTENLLKRRKATVVVADKGMAYYVKCVSTLLRESKSGGWSNCIFNLSVERVLRDDLGGATITSGIAYSGESDVEPHEKIYQELTRS